MKIKSQTSWSPEATPTYWINHAARLLMKRFEQRLRPLGFGMACLPVAVALEEHGALQQKQLAELAHVEQPSMAELLSRMARDGLIVREAHPTDRRGSQISLSEKSKEHLPLAKQHLVNISEAATEGFDEKEKEILMDFLHRIVRNLESLSDK